MRTFTSFKKYSGTWLPVQTLCENMFAIGVSKVFSGRSRSLRFLDEYAGRTEHVYNVNKISLSLSIYIYIYICVCVCVCVCVLCSNITITSKLSYKVKPST